MRRRFGLLPRDESFFELFEQQAAVLRECLPILAAMREADIVDPLGDGDAGHRAAW